MRVSFRRLQALAGKPPCRVGLYLLVFGTLSAVQVSSQPSSVTPPTEAHLTLKAALDLAIRQNLDLAAARLRRAVKAAGVQIAGQRPNPSASFSAAQDTPHESVAVSQTFELGGKRSQRIEVARQEANLDEMQVPELERQIRLQVRQAYFAAAHARANTAQRAKELELTRRVREIAQARLDAGEIPQLEEFQAALEVSRAEVEGKVAQEQEKVSFSRLNALLNEPAGKSWDLTGEFESLPETPVVDALITKARTTNPELLNVTQQSKLEQSRQMLLRAERVPDFTVEVGADIDAPDEFRVGPRAAVSIDVPIFSRKQGELAQSKATQQQLEGTAAAIKRTLAGEVEAAYYDLAARRAEVQLYRDTLLPASERLASLFQESYSEGRSPIMNVLDAQRTTQQLKREYLDIVLAVHDSFAQLEEAVGVPLE